MLAATLSLALLLVAQAVANENAVRSIPNTADNRNYFATTQSLFANGQRRESQSCGDQAPDIEFCIKVCNSPGLIQRRGCCCIATRDEQFFVGMLGGCRYEQVLRNFTSSLIYTSSPASDPPAFFDERTCAPSNVNATGERCNCFIQWEEEVSVLESLGPLPSPTGPPTANTQNPVVFTPTPSENPTPTSPVEPTVTPTAPEIPLPDTETPTPSKPSPTPVVPMDSPASTPAVPTPVAPTAESEAESVTPEVDTGDDDEEDDGSVCVDERYLLAKGVPAEHMVHREGVMARVLCPALSLPCGTPLHKLRRRGVTISYDQLCKEVSCSSRVMRVNAMYSHLWLETEHDGIMLTMYDVSYPELAQQALHASMQMSRMLRNQFYTTTY